MVKSRGQEERTRSSAAQMPPQPGNYVKSEASPGWGKSCYNPKDSFKSPLEKFGFTVSPRARIVCLAIAIFLIMVLISSLVAGLVLGLARTSHASTNLTVDLGYAKYNGHHGAIGISQWLGIRYAAPPTSDLRFRAPQDPPTDPTLQEASSHGPICHFGSTTVEDPSHNEDCLFLDVYAPSQAPGTGKHPVVVFFQGGGFNGLANANTNATSLINAGGRDLVVVTFNYRVGPFGFLASKEVKANGDLNAGLLDQRKVLKWVQKHIDKFGGDPNHVTLSGASAGGASVRLHLTAYGGRNDNLFHAVAGESSSFGTELSVADSQYQYDALVKRLQCDTAPDTIKCLRNASIEDLTESDPDIPTPNGGGGVPVFMWSNTMDGNFTPDYSYNLVGQGKYVKVPIIFGSTTNEGTSFTPQNLSTPADMSNFLKDNFPKLQQSQLDEINSYFPSTPEEIYPDKGAYWRPAADAYGQIRYICPSLFISLSFPMHGVNESWNYHWDVVPLGNVKTGFGVTHVAEQSSIWGGAKGSHTTIMQGYWTSFFRTKDPNTHKIAGAPDWEKYNSGASGPSGTTRRIHFGNNVNATAMEAPDLQLQSTCGYLSGIAPQLGQ